MSNAATLAPAWKPGTAPKPTPASTRPSDVTKALRALRKAAPDAVRLCIKTMNDDAEDIELRIKIALKVIDAVATPHILKSFNSDDTVSSITITIQRQDAPVTDADSAITIDAAPQSETLTIATVPKGHGDD